MKVCIEQFTNAFVEKSVLISWSYWDISSNAFEIDNHPLNLKNSILGSNLWSQMSENWLNWKWNIWDTKFGWLHWRNLFLPRTIFSASSKLLAPPCAESRELLREMSWAGVSSVSSWCRPFTLVNVLDLLAISFRGNLGLDFPRPASMRGLLHSFPKLIENASPFLEAKIVNEQID